MIRPRVKWRAVFILIVTLVPAMSYAEGKTDNRLSEAIRTNDSEKVSTILRNDPSVLKDAERGGMLLYDAILAGAKPEIVSTLLDNGANPNAEIHWNYTTTSGYRIEWSTCPLNLAAWRGKAEIVSLLLAKRADHEGTRNSSSTPLYTASLSGKTNIVSLLLAKGADLKARIRGTPCIVISHPDQMAFLSFLLDRGCNVNAFYTQGSTPLHAACDRGFTDLAVLYLLKGADVDATDDAGLTPLHRGCSWERTQIVRTLLDHGASVNMQTQQGDTPLHFAATRNDHNEKLIRLLLGAGARTDIKNKKNLTALEAAKLRGNANAVRVLTEATGER